ncbi:ABC transporter substrate-binding protein [Nonomuraea jiangxiensis]|uniref:ABC-type branched-chain amino acid transport system, substrate-binding protein n=1 Tax=Nonomuraea jiangxiensis TaxID=633440 RepID=A0A1G9TL43_9ACTN|nr:ABC transporter substrate-binding protein [Nonomuraea jiangxiensis]SDM48437.1 ABC-type branched-chain amino acid transport system, substrate-binding protein [Nonomuraea jiangxiensis]
MGWESDLRPEFARRLRALKDAAQVSVRELEIASSRTPRRRAGQAPLRLRRSTIDGMISKTRPVCPRQEHFEVFVDTCLRMAEQSGRSLPDELGDRRTWDAAYRDLLVGMAGARSTSRLAAEAAERLRAVEAPPSTASETAPSPSPSPSTATSTTASAVRVARPGRRRQAALVKGAGALALTGVAVAVWALSPVSRSEGGGAKSTIAPADVGGDGVLRLGALVPKSGNLQFFHRPMAAGIRLAVADVNAAGGVFGRKVTATELDAGDTVDRGTRALTQLISQRNDVIIGPVTSSMSLTMIDQVKRAGVVQISPTATSDQLTDADDDGLFFRMAAPDAIQGDVLGELVQAGGGRRVGILAVDDPYGRGLSGHVRRSLERRGVDQVQVETYDTADMSYTAEVGKIGAADPDAIVVAGFTETAAIARELERHGLGGRKWYFTDGYLSSGDHGSGLPLGTLTGVRATQAGAEVEAAFQDRLRAVDSKATDFTYAPEAYDATIVAALAAVAAGRDEPEALARTMAEVTRDGQRCTGFPACARLLASGGDIDYDGVSGPIDFTDKGDPGKAPITVFQYAADHTATAFSHELGEFPA